MASVDNSMMEMTPLIMPTSRNDDHRGPIDELEELSSNDMKKLGIVKRWPLGILRCVSKCDKSFDYENTSCAPIS